MSPTLNLHKNDRKMNLVVNNQNERNVFANLFLGPNLAFDSMPDPQPILDFDGDEMDGNVQTSSGRSVSTNGQKSKKKRNEVQGTDVLLRKQAPTFLLIESLIWNFCRTNESNPHRQKDLFDKLCHQLHRLKLIGSSFRSDSLQPIREFILLKFEELISQIKSKDSPLLLSSPSISSPAINSPHLIHQSRYRNDFEDLGLIEAGGFGVVNKAKYRFDDCEYAVKMIRFKYTDKYDQVFKKIIREVQLYANLSSHPNVVGYKTAWLENWCLHREPIPLNKHMKTDTKDMGPVMTTSDDFDRPDDPLVNGSTNDVSIRFEESSKSGIRIEATNGQLSRSTSVEEYKQKTEMDYRDIPQESDDEEESDEEETSSDEDSDSVETFKLQSFDDLTQIRRSVTKRKQTFSMSSNQSHSDSAVEYRECVQLQKYTKPNEIPEINVEDCHSNACPFSCNSFGAILYIQMELCDKNLKTWLRERNDRVFKKLSEMVAEGKADRHTSPVSVLDDNDRKEAKNIFRQVLKGVEYIHRQRLIHRDLKPQNILFSTDGSKVKIGDFGLATLHNSIDSNHVISINPYKQTANSSDTSADDPDNDLNHTGNIGTSIYASPEQKCRKDYDHKTDMFSLGIILFELFHPLSTEMEKGKCVANITKKQTLPPALVRHCPTVSTMILAMTHPNPVLRPNASEVLHSSLFLTEEQMIIKDLEDQNKQFINDLGLKDNKIKELENSLQIERQKRIELELQVQSMKKEMEAMVNRFKFFE